MRAAGIAGHKSAAAMLIPGRGRPRARRRGRVGGSPRDFCNFGARIDPPRAPRKEGAAGPAWVWITRTPRSGGGGAAAGKAPGSIDRRAGPRGAAPSLGSCPREIFFGTFSIFLFKIVYLSTEMRVFLLFLRLKLGLRQFYQHISIQR